MGLINHKISSPNDGLDVLQQVLVIVLNEYWNCQNQLIVPWW
jgi:hypothetical protein